MGYHAAPLVEDPGTFSVRGGIVDVFSPLHPKPIRLEFFGDTVESMRSFDAESQRTIEPVKELVLAPAREVLLTEETKQNAERAVRAAAEAVDIPSSKVRERLEQIRQGLNAFGLEPILPGFFEGGDTSGSPRARGSRSSGRRPADRGARSRPGARPGCRTSRA
jgi:transcription-repair coupling factor (superfamily II helicase)